jgi:predicted ATPase
LQPLSDEQIGEILGRAAPDPVHTAALQLAQRLSGGNPFLALQVFRAAVGSTEWAAEASRWDPLTDVRLSKVLAIRLKGLSGRALAILRAMAVLERLASPGAVAGVAGMSLRDAADASPDLYGRGLIQDADGKLEFVNDVVREYVYSTMTALERTALHLAAARHLDSETDASSAVLARHFYVGQDRARTFEHAMQAARGASESAGQVEAAIMASLAVRSSHGKGQKLSALHLLAGAELESAQLGSARDHLNEILRLDEDMSVEEGVRVKLKVVEALAESSDWGGAKKQIEDLSTALELIADPSANLRLHAETLYWTLKVATRQNDVSAASEAASVAERLAAAALQNPRIEPEARVSAVLSLATYAAFYQSSSKALGLLDDIRGAVESVNAEISERAHLIRGTVATRMARWDEGEHEFRRALDEATRRNDLVQQAGLWNNLACNALEQGEWERFDDWAKKVEEIQTSDGDILDTFLLLALNRANALFYQGNAKSAGVLYGQALESAQVTGSLEFLPELLSCKGLVALQVGDLRAANSMWNTVLETEKHQLVGPQELFKYEWFRSFMGVQLGDETAIHGLIVASEQQRDLDIPSHLKLLWIGSLIFGADFADATGRSAEVVKEALFANRLGWFAGFAQRWFRAVTAKSSLSWRQPARPD